MSSEPRRALLRDDLAGAHADQRRVHQLQRFRRIGLEGDGQHHIAGRQRAQLEASGQPIGGNDLLIASHALALGLTLVTHNTREFSRIVGLQVEDWL